MVKDPSRLHNSSVTNTRGSQTKDVRESHAPFRPRILPQLAVRALKNKIDFVRTKKQSCVYGSDPFQCMSSLPTECLAKTNSLLQRWEWHGRHVKSIYSKARCISLGKKKHFHESFQENKRERERATKRVLDMISGLYKVSRLCSFFFDLLSQVKKFFTGIIVGF